MDALAFFSFGVLFLVLIIFLLAGIGYIFNSFGLYELAKRRSIDNPWLTFIPIARNYIIGEVYDNINSYQLKQTNFKVILLVFSLCISGFNGSSATFFMGAVAFGVTVSAIVNVVFRIFVLISLYEIYQDYSPDNAVLLIVLSAIFYIDFFVLFFIRKNVPVSMCFTKIDAYLFERNKQQLKFLWDDYHKNPQFQIQSWAEFLNANFVPIR